MELSNALGEYLSEGGRSASVAETRYRRCCSCCIRSRRTSPRSCGSGSGNDTILLAARWPVADAALMEEDVVTIVVQVNGKLRGQVAGPRAAQESEVIASARSNEKVVPHLEGKTIVKTIYVPGRLVNLVVEMSRRPLLAALAIVTLLAAGCGGYALVGRGNFLPPDIKTIQVPAFVNRTTRVELEQRVTHAVAEEIVSRGRLRLVIEPVGGATSSSAASIAELRHHSRGVQRGGARDAVSGVRDGRRSSSSTIATRTR